MIDLLKLLKWDIILFNRNRLFLLSGIVAAVYIGVFYLVQPLGNLNRLIVVLIFNDPIVTGYLFAGILLMFDKNQYTLQAISVLPLPLSKYLFSKSMLLSCVATCTAIILALVANGSGFNYMHLILGSFFSAFIFSCFGFSIAAISRSFNQLLFYSIPFFIISGIPFFPVFGYGYLETFFFIPSTGGIGLMEASFDTKPFSKLIYLYLHLVGWAFMSWRIAMIITPKRLHE